MQKWKFVLVLVLAGIITCNIWFWNFNYTKDVRSNYDLGFLYGREIGYNEGNESGYQLGFTSGNFYGYNQGYQLGYSNGNNSGYSLGFQCGNISGFSDGYLKGVKDGAGTGYNIRDPTYEEMINFIAADKTDENEWSENYTCLHFTADVKNNAFNSGYRCGFVHIEFPDGAHAIVCFNTTNNGLIFIEPQDDRIVTLTIGQPYWDRAFYPPPGYNDTVVSFLIIW